MENLDFAEILLKGASLDLINQRDHVTGSTAFMLAVKNYSKRMIQLFMDHQADSILTNNNGETPMIVAINKAQLGLIRRLLQHKANLKATDCKGRTALMIAKEKDNQKVIRLLTDSVMTIEPNANDDVKDEDDSDTVLSPNYRRPKDDTSAPPKRRKE